MMGPADVPGTSMYGTMSPEYLNDPNATLPVVLVRRALPQIPLIMDVELPNVLNYVLQISKNGNPQR